MIEIELQKGQLLFVPPYWWYSCKHGGNSHLLSISYVSIVNSITHIPYKLQSFIQQQNVLPAYSIVQKDKIEQQDRSIENVEVDDDEEDEEDNDEDDEDDENEGNDEGMVEHVVQGTLDNIIENIVDK